ncbi:MAG: adenylate/guanylate cyclase domain-containing protein [Planctomycetota bacterium]|nr:adenylate/guanylate cyclase domain-containing protein [Planctomycetota bacterium]
MPRHAPVLAASLLAVLVVLLLDFTEVFRGVNERLVDTQQRLFPRDTGPYNDNIVLVDIDDGSIDRLGRWPWPRTNIADAVTELRKAGARTIALDIEFSNPQEVSCDPVTGDTRDEDAALAASIDSSTILSTVLAEDELQLRWSDAGGEPESLDHLIEVLSSDITITPEQLPSNLALSPSDEAAFAANQLLIKRRAIQRVLARDDPPSSLAGLEVAIVPSRQLHGVDYPEQPLLEAAWYQHEGIASAQPFLATQDDTKLGSPSDRVPLRNFLDQAGGLGYVNITHRGVDGAIRSIYPAQAIEGGEMLPLGLAAVAHYRGLSPDDIIIEDDTVAIGETTLPLSQGKIWLNWPRSETGWRWRDLHRRTESDPEYRGHLSVSEIIEIGRARRTLAKQRAELADLNRDLVRVIRQDPEVNLDDWQSEAILQEIQDEVDFSLEGVPLDAEPEDFAEGADEESMEMLSAMQQWRQLVRTIEEDEARLDRSLETLSSQVNGALVFIGWTATGAAADFINTAAGPRTPGVLVHATLADMVLQDRGLRLAPNWVGPLAVLVLGILVAILVATLGPWWATTLSLLSIVIYTGIGGVLALALGNMVFPLAAPVIAGIGAWACGTGVQAAMAQRDKRRITRQFRARVSEQLVDALIADPGAISMTGVSREMTIFFADLAGFTRMSESLGSEQIVRILNTYLSALTVQLVEHGAYVNKFLGDGVMAFWSAFREEPAQAHLAAGAALACQETMKQLNALNEGEHQSIGLRVGIATGPAIVGDCGAPPDLNDYTVIGDTANLASRLEGANKQFGTGVMINDLTHQHMADAPVRCRCIGNIQVVGRQTPVKAWEVVNLDFPQDAIDHSLTLAEAIERGDQKAAQATLIALRGIPGQEAFVDRWSAMVDGPADGFGGPLQLVEK